MPAGRRLFFVCAMLAIGPDLGWHALTYCEGACGIAAQLTPCSPQAAALPGWVP